MNQILHRNEQDMVVFTVLCNVLIGILYRRKLCFDLFCYTLNESVYLNVDNFIINKKPGP